MRRLTIALFALLVFGAPAAAAAPGKHEERTYPGGYRALQYTPASLDRAKAAPLFVMVHGCGTTAEQQEAANGLDEQAERDGFVVLYLDHDQNYGLHPLGCWRWFADTERTSADPAAIAAMVRDALARRAPAIDATRVYYAGMSSGAMMGSIVAATQPGLFAAFVLNAGCAYRATTCALTPPTVSTETLARQALEAMGERRRVVPVLISNGDADRTVPPAHSDRALEQWRQTDNLVASGRADGPISATATKTREDVKPGGRSSTVTQYADPSGCPVLERWVIHGMGHFWPGGTTDPASAAFTDPSGPDGGELAWAFFKRHRLGTPCFQEAAPPPCTSRRVLTVRVPAGVRRPQARLDGRRLAISDRRIRVDLRGRPHGTARLVVTGRDRNGRAVRLLRRYRTCTRGSA